MSNLQMATLMMTPPSGRVTGSIAEARSHIFVLILQFGTRLCIGKDTYPDNEPHIYIADVL